MQSFLTPHWIDQYWTFKVSSMQNPPNLLTSHWMDQYLEIQCLDNAKSFNSLDITLNRPIFVHSTSRRCKSSQISWHHIEWTNIWTFKVLSMRIFTNLSTSHWMDTYLCIQSLVNAKSYKFLDITSNGPIFVCSKSRQCKILQISWHHIEWTNIWTFQSLVNADLHKSLAITLNAQIFVHSKSCQYEPSQISRHHIR